MLTKDKDMFVATHHVVDKLAHQTIKHKGKSSLTIGRGVD